MGNTLVGRESTFVLSGDWDNTNTATLHPQHLISFHAGTPGPSPEAQPRSRCGLLPLPAPGLLQQRTGPPAPARAPGAEAGGGRREAGRQAGLARGEAGHRAAPRLPSDKAAAAGPAPGRVPHPRAPAARPPRCRGSPPPASLPPSASPRPSRRASPPRPVGGAGLGRHLPQRGRGGSFRRSPPQQHERAGAAGARWRRGVAAAAQEPERAAELLLLWRRRPGRALAGPGAALRAEVPHPGRAERRRPGFAAAAQASQPGRGAGPAPQGDGERGGEGRAGPGRASAGVADVASGGGGGRCRRPTASPGAGGPGLGLVRPRVTRPGCCGGAGTVRGTGEGGGGRVGTPGSTGLPRG